MTSSLAHAIHGLQNGRLSPHEFFAHVDRALESDEASTEQLRDLLSEEHTRVMLPPEVYGELQRRVEQPGVAQPAVAKPDSGDAMQQTRPAMPADLTAGQASGPSRIKGVGDTLNGRFVLEECIGFGGMGTVYKALDLRKLEASDRKPYIAIKVLNAQFSVHPQSLIALQREAKKAQALAHPNIVAVYDFDRDGPMVYITMEYLAGKPLSHVLRAKDFTGMPVDKAMQIVGGIARALAYAHEHGFVHCDLKPANVFVTNRGDVKVIDFGIARVFRQPDEDSEATVFDAGSLGGLTPAYASPEMIEHLVPDPRDDVYALACITYELLTGKHPFDRLSATQARSKGMTPQRPPHLNYRQWHALRRALAFERDKRTPTVMRFFDDMSRHQRPKYYFAMGAALVVAGALVAVGLAYFHRPFIGPTVAQVDESAPPAGVATPAGPAAAAAAAPAPAPAPAPGHAPLPPLSLAAVAPILSGVPCSALAARADGHTLQVQGYLSVGVGAERLQSLLRPVPGVQTVQLAVEPVSADKCGAMQVFAPYWLKNRQAAKPASLRMHAGSTVLADGDPLVVDIRTPGTPSYVYVDYYSLDGDVAHLVPNPKEPANQAPPNYAATVGSLNNWVVSKPFGTELLVLLTTPVPLFDQMRPEVEPGASYLKAVGDRLKNIAASHGDDRIAVDFMQVKTHARTD